MLQSMRRMRKAIALVIASCVVVSFTVPAWSQDAPPPVSPTIDGNGVDLYRGTIQMSHTDLTIGQPGAGGLSYGQFYFFGGWQHSYHGIVYRNGNNYSASIGQSTETFTWNGSSFVANQGGGSTFAPIAGGYRYTSGDGVVAVFDTGLVTSGASSQVFLSSLAYPSGEKWSYNWNSAYVCAPPYGIECYAIYRLQSLTNNLGYQVRFTYEGTYGAGTMFWPGEETAWLTETGAIGINMKDEYCDPFAEECSLSMQWPSVVYVRPGGGAIEVIQRQGSTTLATTTYTQTFSGTGSTFSIRLPGSSANDVTYTLTDFGGGDRRVTSVVSGGVTWNYSYDDSNPTYRITTIAGPVTRKVWFAKSNQLPVSEMIGTYETSYIITGYGYDSLGRLNLVTLPSGGRFEYDHDARGNVTQTRHYAAPIPDAPTTPLIYNSGYDSSCTYAVWCNKPLWTEDGKAGRTEYTYNNTHGGLETVTAPAPSSTNTVRPKTTYVYTALNAYYKISSSTSAASSLSVMRLTSVSTCRTTSSCANNGDELLTVIGYGSLTSGNNLLPVSVTTRDGPGSVSSEVKTAYDSIGNAISVDGPLAGTLDTTLTIYDGLRRVTGQIGPDPEDGAVARLPRAIKTTYDGRGLPERVDVGTVTSQVTSFPGFSIKQSQLQEFDASRRPIKVTLTSGGTTYAVQQTNYDSGGRPNCVATRMNMDPSALASLPDACSQTTTPGANGPDQIGQYAYNALGNVSKVFAGIGTSNVIDEESIYANGRMEAVKDARDNLTSYTYDGFGRLRRINYPDASTGAADANDYEEMTYDANSQVTDIRRRDTRTIHLERDALNRVIWKTVSGTFGGTTYFSYDNHGRVLFARNGSVSGEGIDVAYDGLGRLYSRTVFGRTITYGYDAAGRRQTLTYPGGFSATYAYNVVGNLLAVSDSTQSPLASYAYDAQGRLTGVTRSNTTSTGLEYDAVDRLSKLTQDLNGTSHDHVADFTYAPSGQIATRTLTNEGTYGWVPGPNVDLSNAYNTKNQLTSLAGASVTQTTAQEVGALDGYTYSYDAEGQLRKATGPVPDVLVDYDPAGMLRKVTQSGVVTEYLYDGPNLIAEYRNGTLTRRYVQGGGIDNPIVWYEYDAAGNPTRKFLYGDERGSVIAVAGPNGAATGTARYSPDGESAAPAAPFGYTGQLWISSLQLYYYKARMYSPKAARFIQPDPIGYLGGMNLYAYVSGDPINSTDPTGLIDFDQCLSFWLDFPSGPPRVSDGVTVSGTHSILETRCFWNLGPRPDPVVDESAAASSTPAGPQGEERTTPPCRMEEDRDTWALTLGGYYGLGFELQFGQDQGNNFVTFRFGYGIGGGISYTPYASIPGPALENRNQDGFVLSASGQAKFAAGLLSTKLEYGAARNYAEGMSDTYGGPNFSFRNRTLGLGASGSVAGQATYYTKRTSYYANQGTCHL